MVPIKALVSRPLVTHADNESLSMFAAMKSGDRVIISLRKRAGIPKKLTNGLIL